MGGKPDCTVEYWQVMPDTAVPNSSPVPGDPYLPGEGNSGYRVTRYDLDLDYRVSTNRLEATAILSAVSTERLTRLSLDLAGLVVSKVSVNGTRASKFSQRDGKLIIKPGMPLAAGASFIVMVRYSGFPHPARSSWGEVGWEELADGVLVAGQPSGAPTWFPCDDRPSAKAPFRISISCDQPYRVLANGTLLSRTARGSRTVWVYETTEPMAPYLATVQIGQYDEQMIAPGPVPQRMLFPRGMLAKAREDFADQPRMMNTFSRLFGPYPFASYTVVVTDDVLEIPLEAHGLSVFGRNHIDGAGGSERLIAHELAHQWFGNSVTVGAWCDIWLHEGFACYAEWLWSEDSGAASADTLARQQWARLSRLPQDLLLADPGADRMFDDRVYKRGALTLHALRLTVGDELFFAVLRGWAAGHRHGSISTAAFVEFAAVVSGMAVAPLLQSWLHQESLPELPLAARGPAATSRP